MQPIRATTLSRLWAHITIRRRRQLVILFLLMVATSFTEAISIGALLPFLGILIAPENLTKQPFVAEYLEFLGLSNESQVMLFLTVFFVLTLLFAGVMRLALIWTQTRLGYAIGTDLSMQIYEKTLFQEYSVHISRNSSEVIAGISSKTDSVIGTTLLPLLNIASSSLMLVAVMAALILINPMVAFGALGGFASIYLLILLATKNRIAVDSTHISSQSNQVIKALQEGLGGIRDILIDGTQQIYCQIYKRADLRMRQSQANIQIIQASPRFILESLGMVTVATLAYYLINSEREGLVVIPILGVFALGAQKLLPIMQQLYGSLIALRGGQASLIDVLALLDQEMPKNKDILQLDQIKFNQSINLENISFKYKNTKSCILNEIDLQILKGNLIGFVGKTGSGKSTLLDIIMGLLEPSEGKLTVDGKEITRQNYRAWQARIAHVPQSIFLADSTIAENIAFGIPKSQIDLSRMKTAARKAQISETIEKLDKGYETFVGERGVKLSGGQRQRIGIARALYKKAEIIILDEATSALDSDTERSVMKAIIENKNNITVLIVSHRLSTLACCDLIVKIDQGRIIQKGFYKDIIMTNALVT